MMKYTYVKGKKVDGTPVVRKYYRRSMRFVGEYPSLWKAFIG